MKIVIIFAIIGLVASRSFNLEEFQTLHAAASNPKLTTAEKLQISIDSQYQKSNSPCKRFNFKGRSIANCGNKSTNISRQAVADLSAKQQARIARYIDLLQSTNMRF